MRCRLGRDRGGAGLRAHVFQIRGLDEGRGRGLVHGRACDDGEPKAHPRRLLDEKRCRSRVELQDEHVGLRRLRLAEDGKHVLHREVEPLLEHHGCAELLEGRAQERCAALAVGGRLIDERRPLAAELLDGIAGLRQLDDIVGGEEAENIGIAQLGDLGRAGDGEERQLVTLGKRQHGEDLRPEDGGDDRDRRARRGGPLERVHRDLGSGVGVGDLALNRDAAGCLSRARGARRSAGSCLRVLEAP